MDIYGKRLRRLVIIVSSASEMRLHWIRRTDVNLCIGNNNHNMHIILQKNVKTIPKAIPKN